MIPISGYFKNIYHNSQNYKQKNLLKVSLCYAAEHRNQVDLSTNLVTSLRGVTVSSALIQTAPPDVKLSVEY